MKISEYTQGRDNNFNLIRIIAAYAVLITHSFALTLGSGDAEPFRDTLGMTMGSIAVDIFFLTSGFLVTASLLKRENLIDFIWARTLRIFPALIVMTGLTVFVLGPYFTTSHSYFIDPKTYKYIIRNITLFFGVAYELPDVFQNNPYRGAVNGSLWTMPYELRMYAILASTWLLLQMAKKTQRINLPKIIISGTALSGLFLISSKTGAIESTGPFLHLFFMFFFGASFYVLQKKIALSRPIFWAALIALLLSTLNKSAFNIAYIATLPYILFYIAYVPSGRIRKFNNFGDYSYGLYIYAFPIQQAIAALIPGASIQAMIIISSGITLIFSILSWHIIEKRALGLKARYVQKTQNFLSLGLKSR